MKQHKAPKLLAEIRAKFGTVKNAARVAGISYETLQCVIMRGSMCEASRVKVLKLGVDLSEIYTNEAGSFSPKHDFEADWNKRNTIPDEEIEKVAERIVNLKPVMMFDGECYGNGLHSKMEAMKRRMRA